MKKYVIYMCSLQWFAQKIPMQTMSSNECDVQNNKLEKSNGNPAYDSPLNRPLSLIW